MLKAENVLCLRKREASVGKREVYTGSTAGLANSAAQHGVPFMQKIQIINTLCKDAEMATPLQSRTMNGLVGGGQQMESFSFRLAGVEGRGVAVACGRRGGAGWCWVWVGKSSPVNMQNPTFTVAPAPNTGSVNSCRGISTFLLQ